MQIDEFWPTGSANRQGGETVALIGSGFTGATHVAFGPLPAAFQVNSDTEIIATAPAYVPGYENDQALVQVWTPEGSASAAGPEWTWGGDTLKGLAELDALLDGATTGAAAALTDRDDLDRVLDPQSPTVLTWEPHGSASTAGGETVRIRGFEFTGASEVRFGPYRTEFTVLDDETIETTAPAFDEVLVLHNAYVRVFNAHGGSSFDGQAEWTWGGRTMAQLSPNVPDEQGPLVVTGCTPEASAGPEGGDEIHVFGSGFAAGVTRVTFGPLEAPNVIVVSDSELITTAPRFVDHDLPPEEARCVRVWRGDQASPVVEYDGRYPSWTSWSWGGRLFRTPDRLGNTPYPDRFAIDSVTPTGSASTAGGEEVVITGAGFQSIGGLTIAGVEVDYRVDSDDRVVAVAPKFGRNCSGASGIELHGPGNIRTATDYQWTWDGKTVADLQR